jgi:hypothetical protein
MALIQLSRSSFEIFFLFCELLEPKPLAVWVEALAKGLSRTEFLNSTLLHEGNF